MELLRGFIFFCGLVVFISCMVAGASYIVDVIAAPVADRLAHSCERRERNRQVMRDYRRRQKAAWKRETMAVALEFKATRRLPESKKALPSVE